jgi:hypothetical protein
MAQTAPQDVLQLKVTLRGIRPPIWRRLLVPARTTLARLHDAIQVAFGWEDYHLHAFVIYGEEYGPRDPDGDVQVRSEKVALTSLGLEPKDKFRYEYDFGDDWVHEITVEKILTSDERLPNPVCLGGKRAGPPEDCGGTGGYEDLLDAMKDADHPRHEEFTEWLDDDWDPEWFSLDYVNICLKARFAPARSRASAKTSQPQSKT